MAAARSMRAISAASFTSRSASTTFDGRRPARPVDQVGPGPLADQVMLSASSPMRVAAGQEVLGRLALGGGRADLDLDPAAAPAQLFGRLGAVAAVGGEQGARRG